MNQITIVYLDHFISKHTDQESFMKDWMQYMTMILSDATHGDTPLKIDLKITFDREEPKLTQEAWDGPTEEEVRENGITPLAITGPGWYLTQGNNRVYIEGCDSAGQEWYGSIETWGEHEVWRPNGEHQNHIKDWMIISKDKS